MEYAYEKIKEMINIDIVSLSDLPNKNIWRQKLSDYHIDISLLMNKSVLKDYHKDSLSKTKERSDFYHWASVGRNEYSLIDFDGKLQEHLDEISTGPKFLSYLGNAIKYPNNLFIDPKIVMDRLDMVHSILNEKR